MLVVGDNAPAEEGVVSPSPFYHEPTLSENFSLCLVSCLHSSARSFHLRYLLPSKPFSCHVQCFVLGMYVQLVCSHSVKQKQVSQQRPGSLSVQPCCPPRDSVSVLSLGLSICVHVCSACLWYYRCVCVCVFSRGHMVLLCLWGFSVRSGPDIYASAPVNLLHVLIWIKWLFCQMEEWEWV